MISQNINNKDKCSNISPIPYKSKYEYFNPDVENNGDDLAYVYSLPKSGFSRIDYLLQNGQKFATKTVSEYVEILLKGNIRNIFRNPNNLALRIDDFVIVEFENSYDIGRVCDFGIKSLLKPELYEKQKSDCANILRIPDIEELKIFNKKIKDESEVLIKSKELVSKYNYDMKVTEAVWQLDRQRLTIYFTAPQRIDFRELVKELAKLFRARIELRQISSREETKRLGDFVGPCGRELCCTSFLSNFEHVTLEHARVQQLSNNISKLSGNCGRLKCCIKYEYDNYAAAFDKYPPIGSVIEFDNLSSKIIKIDILSGKITTYCESTGAYYNYTTQEFSEIIKIGKLILSDNYECTTKYNNFDEELKQLLE